MEKFHDRHHAGQLLAHELLPYANRKDVLILALPRGGVPVAYEIAEVLHVSLDIFIVRKLGLPSNSELAMGAIASGGVMELNESVINGFQVSQEDIVYVKGLEEHELQRRELTYRGTRSTKEIKNKIIILVDDGIATGATMKVAIKALRLLSPKEIIMAVPVAASSTIGLLRPLVDNCICLSQPTPFLAVGQFYEVFDQTEDSEVFDLLNATKDY